MYTKQKRKNLVLSVKSKCSSEPHLGPHLCSVGTDDGVM